MSYRKESDSLGEEQIPQEAYWGIHTQRALKNFAFTEKKIPKILVSSLTMVKKAACLTNHELGFLDKKKSNAIELSCDDILNGSLDNQFPLDALQGGAGTSTNMNVNEVIANRSLERLGEEKGNYNVLHPIEDVNLHQSTNDVYPTALKIASIFTLRKLSTAISCLQGELQKKEKDFSQIVKIGRTELQPAVPLTLGVEFSAFAESISRDRWRVFKCEERLRVINLGGTAIGTGLTAPRQYIFLVSEKLRDITGLGLSRAENLVDATANADCFVEVSGIIKACASNLIKISSDLRLMNLFGEIKVPKVQAGSSIMPGKNNPVILEAVIQAGLKVMANDLIVSEAVSRSSFQVAEFLPLVSMALLESIQLLTNVNLAFAKHISEIKADPKICTDIFNSNPVIITAFIPYIGYDRAGELIKKFSLVKSGNLFEFLSNELGSELVIRTLSSENLLSLGYVNSERNNGKSS